MNISPSVRRVGRIFGYTGLACVALLTLVLGGGLIFLRTPTAERLVCDVARERLLAVGIRADIGTLEGPLPFTLRLRDVRLADEQGEWLSVQAATVRISLVALLQGHALVEELTVMKPELSRLPVFPETQPSAPSDPLRMLEPESLKSLSSTLAGVLERVTVREMRVEEVRLGAAVTGVPLTASFTGGGPLTDLTAQVRAALVRPDLPPLLELAGTLHVGNRGDWLHGLRGTGANPENAPGTVAGAALGAALRVTFPDAAPLSLSALLTLDDARVLAALTAETAGVTLRADRLSVDAGTLSGTVLADCSSPGALLRQYARLTGAELTVPLLTETTTATLEATVSGTLNAPQGTVRASVSDILPDSAHPQETLMVTTSWTVAAQDVLTMPVLTVEGTTDFDGPFVRAHAPQGAKPSLNARISASQSTDGLTIQEMRLASDWLELQGSASLGDALAVNLRAVVPSLHALTSFPVLAGLLEASPLRDVAGTALLEVRASRANAASPVEGGTKLELGSMHWGMPQLQDALGAKAALNGTFILGEEKTELSHLTLEAGQVIAKGGLSLAKEQLKASLTVGLASLKSFGSTLSGPLELVATATGPLRAPGLDVRLTSPQLGVGTGVLSSFVARLETPALGEKGGKGTLRLDTILSDSSRASLRAGAPVRFTSAWEVSPERIRLERTRLEAPGIALSGQLDAVLRQLRLNGGLHLAMTDWAALASLSGLPLSGTPAELQLTLSGQRTQQAEARWSLGALASGSGLSLREVSGEARLDDLFGTLKVALSSRMGAGFIGEGANNAGGALRWKSGRVDVSGSLKRVQATLSVQGKTAADVAATLEPAEKRLRIERLELTDRRKGTRVGVRLNRPLSIAFGKGLVFSELDLSLLPQGTLTGQANLGPRSLSLEAALSGVSVGTARLFTASPVPDGLLSARIALSGSPSRPQGNLSLTVDKLAFPDTEMPPASLSLTGTLTNPSAPVFALEARADGVGTNPAQLSLALPLTFSSSGIPSLAERRPLTGSAFWEGPLASLWRFVPLANTSLSGQGHFDATVSGTLSDPKITAGVNLAKARFEDVLLGLELADINADARLVSDGISRFSCTASDGGKGTAELNGTVGELAAGLPLALHGSLKSLSPLHRNDISVTLSGTADITGPVVAPDIRAAITVDKGNYQIVGSFGTNIPTLDVVVAGQEVPTGPSTAGPQLDVTVTIPNRFTVRGKGLESEWKGQLAVSGPASNPVITGDIRSIRGDFGLLGKQFTLSRGQVSFSGATPPDPLLNILVTYAASNITAEASVSGPASSPTLTLTSQPPLPQDEVVAQVLFGQSASSLGRLEALQLAAEVASLAGFGSDGISVLGEVRDKLGFDVLRFGSMGGAKAKQSRNVGLLQPPGQAAGGADENSIPSLEVGKYVMDNVYVGLEQGMTGDASGVRVEIELTPNLNLEGTSTPQGSEVGVNWKKDY